ncbi:MAG TPA: trehalose-6-phosphate synthase [Candidatus Acidoferrum sp.]|nr:trehalose-6-phosphate synthase [Candidatus Acidoferrum sp.]
MRQTIKFLIGLLLSLALLTWATSIIVQRTTRRWFENDVRLRAELVVGSANETLSSYWNRADRRELEHKLNDITRDERIMAAAACNPDLTPLAATPSFPKEFSCQDVGVHVRPFADAQLSQWSAWHESATLPGGRVLVSAIPVVNNNEPVGFVILVHDLSFAERREDQTRHFILLAFGFVALAAAAATLLLAHFSWRRWSDEIRRLARGEPPKRPEFQPLLRDVRELVDRIMVERETEPEGAAWTPQRLKQTLFRYLHGERVVIVANREPYIHERQSDGTITVRHPASGLVTALEPVMHACSGVWVAHGSGSADRDVVDRNGHVGVPPGEESYLLRRLWLSKEEERGYYYGFSNEGLWPLCHVAHARPTFRTEDWLYYQEVNRRFADAACEEVDTEDPIILVQDYHFALVPQLIRERLPQATVLMFWHIPWPNSERFGICPWRKEILQGMLGNSIIGFHTQFHCNNFMECVDRFLESRIDREENAVVQHDRATLVRPYPISLEWPVHWLKSVPPPEECRASVFAELGLRPDALLGVGVDRLDYTKGVEERFLAIERLLDRYPEFRGRFTFVQLAAPSRTLIERYRQLNENVEEIAARINERFGNDSYRPIILYRAHHEPPTVFRYYRAADLCYVSSLHDGMNLVAKEFVAAREDERGVLVLSQFTGASRELTEALAVNPYDIDEASVALAAALNMSPDEQRERMRAMRAFLAEFNVYRWAGRMLVDAARLRRHERLTGRLAEHWMGANPG